MIPVGVQQARASPTHQVPLTVELYPSSSLPPVIVFLFLSPLCRVPACGQLRSSLNSSPPITLSLPSPVFCGRELFPSQQVLSACPSVTCHGPLSSLCSPPACVRYRCQDNISLPFRVLPVITEMGRTRLEVNVQVSARLGVAGEAGRFARFMGSDGQQHFQRV